MAEGNSGTFYSHLCQQDFIIILYVLFQTVINFHSEGAHVTSSKTVVFGGSLLSANSLPDRYVYPACSVFAEPPIIPYPG